MSGLFRMAVAIASSSATLPGGFVSVFAGGSPDFVVVAGGCPTANPTARPNTASPLSTRLRLIAFLLSGTGRFHPGQQPGIVRRHRPAGRPGFGQVERVAAVADGMSFNSARYLSPARRYN